MSRSPYDRWADSRLLEEADNRSLNPTESGMLESMMKWAKSGRPLTLRQREWLYRILDEKPEDHGGPDLDE